jgi:transaldolase
MPEETIVDYQDHGRPEARLESGLAAAKGVFEDLAKAGVDYADVTDTLEREGVEKFSEAFEKLLGALNEKRKSLIPA